MFVEVENNRNRSDYIALLILLCIPFIQLGLSYYISISFVLFMAILSYCISGLTYSFKLNQIALWMLSLFLLKIALLTYSSADTRAILIPAREFICALGMILIAAKIRNSTVEDSLVLKIILGALLVLLFLVCIQTFFIARGSYIGFPTQYYIMNQETLNKAEDALYHGTRYRPAAFFGEPSYTSWIVLSLLTVALCAKNPSRNSMYVALILSFLVVLVSFSMAGIFAVAMLCTYWFVFETKKVNSVLLNFMVALVAGSIVMAVLFYFGGEVSERIVAILNSDDDSANNRLAEPMEYIDKILIEGHWFGLKNYADLHINNAGLGMIINYGVLFIPILGVLLFFVKRKLLLLYIVLSLNFNGTFFRFDKALIVGVTIGLCLRHKSLKESSNKMNFYN